MTDNPASPGAKRLAKPAWLRVKAGGGPVFAMVAETLQREGLHTVCQSARCPNRGECWSCGTATFMILGDRCTRHCTFCAVPKGKPQPPNPEEPAAVARAVAAFKLRYAVVTSVTRDDLEDGGAAHFAATIRAIRLAQPECRLEVLIPDFGGRQRDYHRILETAPDVFNHNLETVPRLYPRVRPEADFHRSLDLLAWFAQRDVITKSGLMLGLGETMDEVIDVMRNLRSAGCSSLTLGQYLQPNRESLSVVRYVTPEEFAALESIGLWMGFTAVASGPLVRSSFRAAESFHTIANPLQR